MSNVFEASSGSSRSRRCVSGIPKRCWCGASVVVRISKSEANPFRRFFRCSFAASQLLSDDDHVFKWIDAALINEIETLGNSIDRVENLMMEQLEEMVMSLAENLVMEKVEDLVKERVDRLVLDRVDKLVEEKFEKLLMEKLDKLVMEKVQEELLCMKLE